MNSIELIKLELEWLGYQPEFCKSQPNEKGVLVFEYKVVSGRYQGNPFKIGLSMAEEGYPEYPPHFIHILNINTTSLTPHSTYEKDGPWKVFSVPPNDFWDKLPQEQKNMKTYISTHLNRVWNQL